MVINTNIPNRICFNKLINTLLLKVLICASILLSTFSSYGQNSVESLMALYAEEGQHNRIESPFNGVMLVAKNDKILLKKSYGFHDIAKKY